MKAVSLNEIKKELAHLDNKTLQEVCMRVAKYKLENKELLTYLLFEAHHEQGYIESIKKEMDGLFAEINTSHLYYAKKSLRKIGRIINKYCRYSGSRQTEVELRTYFCSLLQSSGITLHRNPAITKIYEAQLKKVNALIDALHEDLQHDYRRELEKLNKD